MEAVIPLIGLTVLFSAGIGGGIGRQKGLGFLLGAVLGLVFGPLGVVAIAAMEGQKHNAYSRLVSPSVEQVVDHLGDNNSAGWNLIGMETEQSEQGHTFHFTWETVG